MKIQKCLFGAVLPALLVLIGTSGAYAATTNLSCIADTFILARSPDNNAGAHTEVAIGRDGQALDGRRHGLFQFDLTAIPAGSTVTSAIFQLSAIGIPTIGDVDSTFSLHRLTASWVEGTKVGTSGAPAATGEVTWNSREHALLAWTTPGGDFDVTASAATFVSGVNSYQWTGTSLTANVQLWVNNPAQNNGVLLMSDSEATAKTAKRFGSREGGQAAVLVVGYVPASPLSPATIGSIDVTTNDVQLTWNADAAQKYDVFYRRSMVDTQGWLLAEANIPASTNGTNVWNRAPYLGSPEYPPNEKLCYRVGALAAAAPGVPLALDVVASNFVAPVGLKEPNDGTHRFFVVDQIGKIMIVASNGTVMAAPFLDITNIINNLGPAFTGATNGLNPGYDERGLQGMAFDPGFTTNKRFFVYYNSPKSGSNINCEAILAAYHVSSTNVNVADTNGTIIFRLDKPEFNHNGGCITFGPDGYLYLPTGDGGGAGDQHGTTGNAQDKNSYLGKILRLNVSSGTNYTIPPDNPFVGGGGLGEIYAYGFRHPWRISFDHGASNRLVVADVGQDLWEEVDIVQKGGNYGWRIIEGNHAYDPSVATTLDVDVTTLDYPIHEYPHGPLGIAIIGAAMYRGTNYPELVGNYVFGDFSTSFAAADGHLYYLSETRSNIWERFAFTLSPSNAPLGRFVKSFGEDQAGELYLLSSTNLGPTGTSGDIRHLRKP
jgi:glucose/arabinose dehydrogenase